MALGAQQQHSDFLSPLLVLHVFLRPSLAHATPAPDFPAGNKGSTLSQARRTIPAHVSNPPTLSCIVTHARVCVCVYSLALQVRATGLRRQLHKLKVAGKGTGGAESCPEKTKNKNKNRTLQLCLCYFVMQQLYLFLYSEIPPEVLERNPTRPNTFHFTFHLTDPAL